MPPPVGPLLTLLIVSCASAQRRLVSLDVRVNFVNDRPAGNLLHVQLLSSGGTPVAEQQTGNNPRIEFNMLAPGTYRLRVTGPGIEDTTTDSFTISPGELSHQEVVRVKAKSTASGAAPPGAPISADELNLPKKALQEYDKGNRALAREHFEEGRKHLEKAIGIAPQFARAHHNLGVACAHLNDVECARRGYQESIKLNPRLAPAYINLARVEFGVHNFPEVQSLLRKYVVLSPQDPQAFTMLSEAELLMLDFADALSDARKVYSLPGHENFAVAHYVAACALEAQQHLPEAAAEYQAFLNAQPNSPEAAMARAALERLRSPSH